MDRKVNIYTMYAIVFLQGLVFYGPIATLYRQSRGISMYEVFIIESVCLAIMLGFEIPWGWIADRIGYKKVIVLSNLIFLVSKIIFFKAYSFEIFLLERVFLGIAVSGLSGCDIALLYGSCTEDETQKVFGRYNAYSTAGLLIASVLTSFIVHSPIDELSIARTGFLTIIPYSVALLLSLCLKDVKRDKAPVSSLRKSFKLAFKNKSIILIVVAAALMGEMVQAITVWLNQMQYTRSGIDIKYFGILLVAAQLVRLCSAKSHRLTHKLGKVLSIQILYGMMLLSCLLLIVTKEALFSIAGVMLIAAGMALSNPVVLEIQNKEIETGDRATILSIYAMLGDSITVVVNPIIGRAADISVVTSLGVCLIMAGLAYIMLYIYIKNKKEFKDTK